MTRILGLPDNTLTAGNKPAPPAFYIESDVSGYCGLCNVPGVNGTGVGSCEVSDQCGGLNLPSAAQRYANM